MTRAAMIGSAPDSWRVWYADNPQQTPWQRFLDEGNLTAGKNTRGIYSTVVDERGGYWGGQVPADFRVRFACAYDLEVQAWADASRRGDVVGPTSWGWYAATAVCTAGMESLGTGRRVRVDLADRAAVLGGAA
jgi:myo-inositol 2-dehydrogenase/D-chiro-inositol 1-dehydrogenase